MIKNKKEKKSKHKIGRLNNKKNRLCGRPENKYTNLSIKSREKAQKY